MDENPYRSPESEPLVEELAEPSLELIRRRNLAFWTGFMVTIGLVFLQMVLVESFWPFVAVRYLPPVRSLMFVVYVALATPCGVLVGLWTWRDSSSSRAFWVAGCFGMSTVLLALILEFFYVWM